LVLRGDFDDVGDLGMEGGDKVTKVRGADKVIDGWDVCKEVRYLELKGQSLH